jgi:hypothetical protein
MLGLCIYKSGLQTGVYKPVFINRFLNGCGKMAVFNLLRLLGHRLSLARKFPFHLHLWLGKMSGSGATYYDEEPKYLYSLLKNLPDVIPEGNAHDFTNYVPDPQKTKDFGCTKSHLIIPQIASN